MDLCNDSSSKQRHQREPQCHCPRESRSRPKDAVFLNTGQFHLTPAWLSLFAPAAAHSWAPAQELKFWTSWKSSTSAMSGTASHLPGISLPARTRLFPAVESNSKKAALASRLFSCSRFPAFFTDRAGAELGGRRPVSRPCCLSDCLRSGAELACWDFDHPPCGGFRSQPDGPSHR